MVIRVKRPKNEEEKSSFHKHACTLAGWLDHFEIKFSGSRCEFGKPHPPFKEDDVLQIKIALPNI